MQRKLTRETAYLSSPRLCRGCSASLPYAKRKLQFCTKSCSAKTVQVGKTVGQAQRQRTKNALISWRAKQPGSEEYTAMKLAKAKKKEMKVRWPTTPVRPCSSCGLLRRELKLKYCDACVTQISTYRARAAFKFNVFEYPNVFDTSLITDHGWYSPGGRKGRNREINMHGVARDHLYTISDGFHNKVPPQILAHPANCRIILQSDNSAKNSRSSIDLPELMKRISDWNLTDTG